MVLEYIVSHGLWSVIILCNTNKYTKLYTHYYRNHEWDSAVTLPRDPRTFCLNKYSLWHIYVCPVMQILVKHILQLDVQATWEDHAEDLQHADAKSHSTQDDEMIPNLVCQLVSASLGRTDIR